MSAFRFLQVRTNAGFWRSKRVYEIALPAIVSALVSAVYFFYPEFFAESFLAEMSNNVFQFMVFVVPFHLAALGAFSTFQSPILDEPLKGANAELRTWSNEDNDYFYKDLKLRQYVSLLFGYLCTLGIVYISIYILLSSVNIQSVIVHFGHNTMSTLFFLFLFCLSHYVFLSVYAVTFLFEKVVGIER